MLVFYVPSYHRLMLATVKKYLDLSNMPTIIFFHKMAPLINPFQKQSGYIFAVSLEMHKCGLYQEVYLKQFDSIFSLAGYTLTSSLS